MLQKCSKAWKQGRSHSTVFCSDLTVGPISLNLEVLYLKRYFMKIEKYYIEHIPGKCN